MDTVSSLSAFRDCICPESRECLAVGWSVIGYRGYRPLMGVDDDFRGTAEAPSATRRQMNREHYLAIGELK